MDEDRWRPVRRHIDARERCRCDACSADRPLSPMTPRNPAASANHANENLLLNKPRRVRRIKVLDLAASAQSSTCAPTKTY